jgi:hypothetical protein
MRNNIFRASVALGVAGAVAFGAGAAFAGAPTTAGCQKKVEGNAVKFQAAVGKALTQCADAIQGEISKGVKGSVAKSALKCESALAGVYGTGKAADKFRTSMTALYPGTCTDDGLLAMGHLLSGPTGTGTKSSAPPSTAGSSAIKFTTDFLLVTGEFEATRAATNQVGGLMNLLAQAQMAISIAGVCPSGAFPNLCAFKVECKTMGCKLGGTTTALLNSAVLGMTPLALTGTEPFDLCEVTGPLTGTEPGIIYIAGGPARTLAPVNAGVAWVCVDSQRGTGWCDCSGHGLQLDTDFCQDRLVPGAPATADACGADVNAGTADKNFSGTKLGLPVNSPSGSSAVGDCYDLSTIQFTIVPIGSEGVDTIPCTPDDVATPSAPIPVPLTTGNASAQVKNAVSGPAPTYGYGKCQDSSTDCVETANCSSLPGVAACTGVTTATLTLSIGPGNGIACSNYQTGQLAGLKMVGAFPSGGGDQPIADAITSFTIDCVP